MNEPLLLGIDVGTTRAKVGAFRLDGRQVAMQVAPYRFTTQAKTDAAEQDALEWWTQIIRALRAVVAELEPHALLGVCVNGQGPTLVAVDETLTPTAPALTWLERRSAPFAHDLGERAGRLVPSHSFIAKAMFLANAQPEAYARTRWFLQAWDFIASQLGGRAVVSSSAGVLPWDDELVNASGLNADKFPAVQRMGTVVGSVSPAAAQATGLPEGLPIVGGITDYFGGILGSGAVYRGLACDNGGTSSSFNVCWDEPLTVEGIFCSPSFQSGYWLIGGPASTTGRALDWWRSSVLGVDGGDWSLVAQAREIPPGSDGLVFLPYLAGERAPLWNVDARGVFFGLGLEHGRAHLTRAVMEAVAFALCHIQERITCAGAQVESIHSCGGQASSELWCQIKADATGRRVIVPEVLEAAVLGAAVIAGVGVGAFEDVTQGATRMMRPRQLIEPNPEHHARYQQSYALYRELYQAVEPLYGRGKKR